MKIKDIDKNFAPASISGNPILFCSAKEEPFLLSGLYGVFPDEPFRRIPEIDGAFYGVNMLSWNTAGIKARFRTDSPYIAIRAEIEDATHMAHMTLCGSCGFALYSFNGKEETFSRPMIPTEAICHGERTFQCMATVGEGPMRSYTLYFPLYNGVKNLEIGFAPDACVERGDPFLLENPVVYYGSSITQGGCATHPGNAYPALITHKTNVDSFNLGFSGSAVGDTPVAEYISNMPMSAFVMDYDYNACDPEYLKSTHEPFFRLFRQKQPATPVIMISAPYNAKEGDDRTRRDIIKETYENALAAGDENVYFIDGGTLFEGDFSDACTVDGVHPNDLGFVRMAKGILPVLKKALNI